MNRSAVKSLVRNARGKARPGRKGKARPAAGPNRIDPTRTGTLRRAFGAKLRQQFARLKGQVVKLLVEEDAFGLAPRQAVTFNAFPAAPALSAGRYASDPQKLEAFQQWLKVQLAALVRGKSQEQLWDAYIQDGFRKGAGRAFDDVRKSELARRRPELFTEEAQASVGDFYAGSREEFLRSSFAQPVAREKVQLLAARSFDELENVTEDMGNKMSRALTDGLVQGKGPREVARDINDAVDLGAERSLVVARTELIRAHAEGQLTALETLGVEEVGVAVEWSAAGDGNVCPECQDMEGVVLKIDEARGMIPRHPNCRCSFIPANVGEDDEDQKRSQKEVQAAIRASAEGGGDDFGPGVPIGRDRPESVLNRRLAFLQNSHLLERRWEYPWRLAGGDGAALNAFCPTGPGGGIDPSCGPSAGAPAHDSPAATDHLATQLGRLDREGRLHNSVPLTALRAAHPDWSREQFDSVLTRARIERKVSLAGAEGRHGVSGQERADAIQEADPVTKRLTYLTHASLRK